MVTESGVIMGTPAYMAPEQVRASSKVDGRADIYAIGVMLYEVLCGERPFRGPLPALLAAQMFDEAPRPSSVAEQRGVQRPQIDWPQMDRVVQRAMAKDAQARHPDCGALLQDLRAASANLRASSFLPTLNRPLPTVVSGGPILSTLLSLPSRQRNVLWAAAALLIAGSVTGGLLYRRASVRGVAVGGAGSRSVLPAGDEAIERARSLVAKASRGNPVERRELLLAIATVHSRGQRSVVMASILDSQPAVWRAAVQAAAAVAQPSDGELAMALRTLAGRATGPSAVDVALARLAVGDSAAEATLRSALNGAALDPESRLRAAMALTESAKLSLAELRAVVAREVRASAVRPSIYRAAMARLLRQGDKETQRRVNAALRSDQLPLQREAAEILARAGQSAGRDKLWTLARTATGSDQLELVTLLAELDDPRTTELLLPLLGDASPVVRQRAAGALGALAGSGAGAATKTGLARLVADADPQVAVTAAVALLKSAEPAAGAGRKLAGDGS